MSVVKTKINRIVAFGFSTTELFRADTPEPNGQVPSCSPNPSRTRLGKG